MKKKERSLVELLQVLLDNESHFNAGLCLLISDLTTARQISVEERGRLKEFTRTHIPRRAESRVGYWWRIGDWKPRHRWLVYYINRLKKENGNNKLT